MAFLQRQEMIPANYAFVGQQLPTDLRERLLLMHDVAKWKWNEGCNFLDCWERLHGFDDSAA